MWNPEITSSARMGNDENTEQAYHCTPRGSRDWEVGARTQRFSLP